jgi:1-aminocyclopropane-1-carboxylate synthase
VNFGTVDQFSPDAIVVYEKAIVAAAQKSNSTVTEPSDGTERTGAKIRFLLICNPHNPTGQSSHIFSVQPFMLITWIGQCYPKETLSELVDLCARHNIHLVSDEIYALSVFRELPRGPNFTSVLSIESNHQNASQLVHVLYGMSKVTTLNIFNLKI